MSRMFVSLITILFLAHFGRKEDIDLCLNIVDLCQSNDLFALRRKGQTYAILSTKRTLKDSSFQ